MIALQFKMSGAGFEQHSSGYEIKSRVITQSRPLVNITLTLINWKFTRRCNIPFHGFVYCWNWHPSSIQTQQNIYNINPIYPLRTPTTWKFFFFWHSSKKNDTECQQLTDVVSKLSIRK